MSADNATQPPAHKALPHETAAPVSPETFRSRFCERFGCEDKDYEKVAFSKLLFAHARLVAPLIRVAYPEFFREDLKFVEYLGNCTGNRDMAVELQEFKDANRTRGGVVRMNFYLRVSGKKAKRIYRELKNHERPSAAALPKPAIIP